jgi:uncharacterized glyoxalase superfamily protein PhnB
MENKMQVKPIPEGYHTITPYLVVNESLKLVEFLKNAFGAEVRYQMLREDGAIMHAELKIGNSMLMLSEAMDEHPAMPIMLYLYVEDVDSVYKKAVNAGGISAVEPMDQFYGDRSGAVKDISGNTWWIGTHIEDVPDDEIKRRDTELRKKKQEA